MVSFTVRMRFADEDHQQISEILGKLAAASRQEPGCVSYVPHWIEGDPSTVLIYEQYKDGEALDAHRASPHFKQYVAGGLYQLMRERSVENLTAVV
jgi:quinol monooxygenase YgiN